MRYPVWFFSLYDSQHPFERCELCHISLCSGNLYGSTAISSVAVMRISVAFSHFLRKFGMMRTLKASRNTANRRMRPLAVCTQKVGTPVRVRALSMEDNNSTPPKAPTKFPRPPHMLTPPTTEAAITEKTIPCPSEVGTEFSRAARTIPPSAAKVLLVT